jgi:uroporphyrinogen-III synthase
MTVFISRNLKVNSPLLRWADTTDNTVTSHSYLAFEPVRFIPPTDADWWFFYSPRAVQFGLRGVGEMSHQTRLAAMGPGTAEYLLNGIGRVDFQGDGNPERTAKLFSEIAAGQRVFFPRAKQSRLSVQTALADQIRVLDAVCYDNIPAPASAPIKADVYIFTSPLNVAAYVDHQPLPDKARVIAIGPSTGAALLERGIECTWPEEASEEGIVEML